MTYACKLAIGSCLSITKIILKITLKTCQFITTCKCNNRWSKKQKINNWELNHRALNSTVVLTTWAILNTSKNDRGTEQKRCYLVRKLLCWSVTDISTNANYSGVARGGGGLGGVQTPSIEKSVYFYCCMITMLCWLRSVFCFFVRYSFLQIDI